jgi:hypothetical protein
MASNETAGALFLLNGLAQRPVKNNIVFSFDSRAKPKTELSLGKSVWCLLTFIHHSSAVG